MSVSDDQLRAIGRITVAFSDLEYSMNLLVWRLINPNIDIGRIVLEGESFDRMLTRAKSLSVEVARENTELGSRIQQWARKAESVKRRRNDVLHAQWPLMLASGQLIGVRRLRKERRVVDASPAKLNRLADDIENVREELEQIIDAQPHITG